ncbi:cytidine deaminase [Neolewinella antarctica]|uniref:Cytidine deaminase n=1 Tax=Neolewinella antarctica TaxID=442734 RepID=A0ABX0XBL7_9BACT|nr:cytidine deaminase [Neolewinella antarctica]NJC26602.1 cytidine deaminase [Neolewinella antarctica]
MATLTITYDVFEGPEALGAADRELLAAARAALENSYSPYSNFRVGAAARLRGGAIARGWNTENAAYPMCLCAEPAALAAAANLQPGVPVTTMAITVKSPSQTVDSPASPCGSCRQQLTEHETRFGVDLRIILRGEAGPIYVFHSAKDLLPFGFASNLL